MQFVLSSAGLAEITDYDLSTYPSTKLFAFIISAKIFHLKNTVKGILLSYLKKHAVTVASASFFEVFSSITFVFRMVQTDRKCIQAENYK